VRPILLLDSTRASVIYPRKQTTKEQRMYKIIGSDQKQYGPVSENDLRQWIAQGRVNAQTLIQAEGQTD